MNIELYSVAQNANRLELSAWPSNEEGILQFARPNGIGLKESTSLKKWKSSVVEEVKRAYVQQKLYKDFSSTDDFPVEDYEEIFDEYGPYYSRSVIENVLAELMSNFDDILLIE